MANETACASAVELMRARAGIYRMFASLYFKELTIDQMRSLADSDLSCFGGLDPAIAEGVRDVTSAVRHTHEVAREDWQPTMPIRSCRQVRRRTRSAPVRSRACSPRIRGCSCRRRATRCTGSCWRSMSSPMLGCTYRGPHLLRVRVHGRAGRARSRGIDGRGRAGSRPAVGAQRRFHAEHLENWMDAFCDAVLACCRTRFTAAWRR